MQELLTVRGRVLAGKGAGEEEQLGSHRLAEVLERMGGGEAGRAVLARAFIPS